jgi:hypothetical protein
MIFHLAPEIGGVDTSDPSSSIGRDAISTIASTIFSGIPIDDKGTELYVGHRARDGKGLSTASGRIFLATKEESIPILQQKTGPDIDGPELIGVIPNLTRAALNAGRKTIENGLAGVEKKRKPSLGNEFKSRMSALATSSIILSGMASVDDEFQSTQDTRSLMEGWIDEVRVRAEQLVDYDPALQEATKLFIDYTNRIQMALASYALIAHR